MSDLEYTLKIAHLSKEQGREAAGEHSTLTILYDFSCLSCRHLKTGARIVEV